MFLSSFWKLPLLWKIGVFFIILGVSSGVYLCLPSKSQAQLLQILFHASFGQVEKVLLLSYSWAKEIYNSVNHQHQLEAIVEQSIKRSKQCLNVSSNYYSPDLYQVLASSKERVLVILGPNGSLRYTTVKYFLCDTNQYEISVDFDAAPSEGTEFIKYFEHIIGEHPDIDDSKEAAFLEVLNHLKDAVELQKKEDPQFRPYIVFRGIDNLAKIDSVCLHHLLEWSINPTTKNIAHIIFISSANILLEDVIGTERLMHRHFLLASVGYANTSQVNRFFEMQLFKHNKTVTKEEQKKILQVTNGSINDILLFFNYFSTQSVENALHEMLKIARFRVSTVLLGLKGLNCNVSSQVMKSVIHSLGCNSGYLLYEKMLDIVSLDDLKCLIRENFLVLRSNIDEADEPIGIYVASISPLYASIFQEIVNKDPQSFCKPTTTCSTYNNKDLSCYLENNNNQ